MRRVLAFSAVAAAGFASAQQAANFNVSAEDARAHMCGDACQANIKRQNQLDLMAVGANFDYGFYATALNFTSSKPGDVLKLEPLDPTQYSFKAGTSVWRLQYTSVDLDGQPVPVTGFIAFPYTTPPGDDDVAYDDGSEEQGTEPKPNRKFRLAAFAHGTIGVFPGCAPSNGPSLYDYDSWQPLVARGYAVVATDYAGLGNNYTMHKYCSFPAHAADVYYSVLAARSLFGAVLTPEWISIGHSQGGGTAWKLAESDFVRTDTAYLGTVALAPATYIIDMLLKRMDGVDHPNYLPYLTVGVEAANPQYHETLLSETLRRRIAMAKEAQLCTMAFMGLTADLRGNAKAIVSMEGVKRDMSTLLAWQNSTAPAMGGRSEAPMLVVQGLNDTTVLPRTTIQAVESSCASGSEIHLSLYPGLEHSPLLQASEAEWMGWIDDLFAAGRLDSIGECSSNTKRVFNEDHVKLPGEE
ncbi:hypothetical protein CDD83_5910 [Cordyceps sp. RAO-2017]|nr:hypothetical protein CDD83_5910 [Cordyceps sp. RAO-2017]